MHGAHHQELTRVYEITQQLSQSTDTGEIAELFREMRTVTSDYAIPVDGCEAYQTAYVALKSANELHEGM